MSIEETTSADETSFDLPAAPGRFTVALLSPEDSNAEFTLRVVVRAGPGGGG